MREIMFALLKTGSGSFLVLFFGVLTTKIFAVTLGPAGLGLYSLLRQTRELFITITFLNGGAALVQGISSRKGAEREEFNLTVFIIISITWGVVALFLLIFAPLIARLIFNPLDDQSIILVRLLPLPILFGTLVFYYGGLLNGHRAVGRMALVHALVAAITAFLAYPVALQVNRGYTEAFLIMMTASSLIAAFLGFWFVKHAKWAPALHNIKSIINSGLFYKLSYFFLSFALTMLITGFAQTGTILAIRAIIASTFGLTAAGFFDVSWTLSVVYITVLLSSFGAYYLPALSQKSDDGSRSNVINQILLIILFIFVPLITALTVLKPGIVSILYSSEFLPSLSIARWMIITIYIKAIGWVFAVTILASADKKTLLFTEITSNILFLTFTSISIFWFNSIEGIGIGFSLVNFLYLIYTYFYAKNHYKFSIKPHLLVKFGIGFLFIIIVSTNNWNDVQVNIPKSVLWLSLAATYSALLLTQEDWKKAYTLLSRKAVFLYKWR
jgi:O-antigen/teichoic acid export membrane protein